MPYRLIVRPRAQRDMRSLQPVIRERTAAAMFLLPETPRPRGVTKFVGRDLWRIRVGDYRIIYEIDDDARIVRVVRVGHRRDVYRGLDE